MFSKSGTGLVAILLASSAAAAPLSAAQSDGVQAVMNAIKAQLKAQNISDGDIVADKTEAHLKDVGFLDDNTISELDDQIKSMTSEGGISIDEIAEILIEELRSEDSIQKRDQEGIAKALVIDDDLIERLKEKIAQLKCPPEAKPWERHLCCPM